MVAEMQMMKERMDFMMNTLRGQVSSDLDELVHRIDSPFTSFVTSFPFPPKFYMPQVEAYDGFKDPLDHSESFKTSKDEIVCRAFPTTLKAPTRVWFSMLTPNSISAFKELSAQFASQFIGGHRYKKSTACLMNIKQQEDETLRSYITHFNKDALSIDEADDKILVTAFTNGLWKGKFLFSLYKNDLKTMSNALLAREEKPKKRERQEEARQNKGRKTTKTGDWREDRRSKPPTGRFASFTLLNNPIDQVSM